MSLILEALKRSEQQRRLGEAPTLATPVIGSRRRRSALPFLAASVIVVLGVGWWLLRTPNPVSPNAARTNASSSATAPATPRGTGGVDHAALPGQRETERRAERTRRIKAKQAAMMERSGISPTGMPAHPGSVTVPPIPDRMKAGPLPQPAKEPSVKAASPIAPTAPPPAAPQTRTNTQSESRPTPVAAPPRPANPPQHAGSAIPSIWELPYATRKELPELHLTMHVYSVDPKQRFVVINGERHVEGDDLGEGLALHSIHADGIVLDYKGKQFFYPRDGR